MTTSLTWSLPSIGEFARYGSIGLAAGVAFGVVAGVLRDRLAWRVGYTRKIYHFAIFTLAAAIGIRGGFTAVQAYGGAVALVVLFAVWRGADSSLFRAVARPTDAPHERFYVVMPLCMTALGGLASNLLFGPAAVVGYAVTGWGDAVGEPVGTAWGRHRYRVPTLTGIECFRSLEGSSAVFLASLLAATAVLGFGGLDLTTGSLLLAVPAIALVATLVEAYTFHSLDNLTIQLAASGVAWLWLQA